MGRHRRAGGGCVPRWRRGRDRTRRPSAYGSGGSGCAVCGDDRGSGAAGGGARVGRPGTRDHAWHRGRGDRGGRTHGNGLRGAGRRHRGTDAVQTGALRPAADSLRHSEGADKRQRRPRSARLGGHAGRAAGRSRVARPERACGGVRGGRGRVAAVDCPRGRGALRNPAAGRGRPGSAGAAPDGRGPAHDHGRPPLDAAHGAHDVADVHPRRADRFLGRGLDRAARIRRGWRGGAHRRGRRRGRGGLPRRSRCWSEGDGWPGGLGSVSPSGEPRWRASA